MPETYASDNTFNVIEDHVIRALQGDADLGTGGALQVATWEQELRDHAGEYRENELPVIAVTCLGLGGQDLTTVPNGLEIDFPVVVWVVSTAAAKIRRTQKIKEFAARVVRVLLQQHLTTQQLDNLPAALEWAESGSVTVRLAEVGFEAGTVERQGNVFRAVAAVSAIITVSFQVGG